MKILIILSMLFSSSFVLGLESQFPNSCRIKSNFAKKGYVTLKNLRNLPFLEIDGEVFYLDNSGVTGKNQLNAYNDVADITAQVALSFGNRFEGKIVFEGRQIARGFCQ